MFYIDRLFEVYKAELQGKLRELDFKDELKLKDGVGATDSFFPKKCVAEPANGYNTLKKSHSENNKIKSSRNFIEELSLLPPDTLRKEDQLQLSSERGGLYSLAGDDIPLTLDFALTGFYLYPYYVVFKASDYAELGCEHHLPTQVDGERIIIETNNVFFLTSSEVKDALYRGTVDADLEEIVKSGLYNREIITALKIRREFNQMELSLTEQYRNRSDFSLTDRTVVNLPAFPYHLIDSLPLAAANDAVKADEHFAEKFILKREPKTRKLYLIFDNESVGKYGLLMASNVVLFAGYLPQSIYLGLDDTLNTKSLFSALRLFLDEEIMCPN